MTNFGYSVVNHGMVYINSHLVCSPMHESRHVGDVFYRGMLSTMCVSQVAEVKAGVADGLVVCMW